LSELCSRTLPANKRLVIFCLFKLHFGLFSARDRFNRLPALSYWNIWSQYWIKYLHKLFNWSLPSADGIVEL
jgi:hypothetical protein